MMHFLCRRSTDQRPPINIQTDMASSRGGGACWGEIVSMFMDGPLSYEHRYVIFEEDFLEQFNLVKIQNRISANILILYLNMNIHGLKCWYLAYINIFM